MKTLQNILNKHSIKSTIITTPKGLLLLADNEDGTFKEFNNKTTTKEIQNYLGY